MNILTILTGGTIGSSTGETVALDDKASSLLLDDYSRKYGDCRFTAVSPLYTLSENMSAAKLAALYRYIRGARPDGFDGIIITHGTDTLSYTAAFLGLALADTAIPVVITGANHPLGDTDSNAAENFRAAVLLVKSGIKGVFAAYKSRDRAEYYRACDICEADGLDDCFSGKICGFSDGEVAVLDANMPAVTAPAPPANFACGKRVLMLRAYPDMRYDRVSTEDYAAVLHLLYHSATACTEGENTSLCGFVGRCGVPVYGAPFKRGEVPYSTTAELLKSGLIPLYGLTAETAYAMLTIAYNHPDMTAEEYISRCGGICR